MQRKLKAKLSKKQLEKLANGQTVHIPYSQIGKGKEIYVDESDVRPTKTGITIKMSKQMVTKNGGSIFGSILKGLAKVGVAGGTTLMTGNPMAGAAAGAVSSPLIDYAGDKLGLGFRAMNQNRLSGRGMPSRGRDFMTGAGVTSVVDDATKMTNEANKRINILGSIIKDTSGNLETSYGSLRNLVGNGVAVAEMVPQTQNLQQLKMGYGRGSRKGGRGGIVRIGYNNRYGQGGISR